MLDSFIKSYFFENKCFFFRRHIPYLNQRYIDVNNLGGKSKDNETLKKANESLNIIQSVIKDGVHNDASEMPKIIWMYWHSTIEQAPDVVKLSFQSWSEMNPDYEVRFLNDENIVQDIGFDFFSIFDLCLVKLTMAMKADILRLYLLTKFGGVWADSTTFCLKPLSSWLPTSMAPFDFFTFRHKTISSRPLEAWFIASEKNSKYVLSTLTLFIEHLFKPRNIAIFVSNRRKFMEKIGYKKFHPNMIYANAVHEAESHGFMPYFSVGYFFNDSLKCHLSKGEISNFLALPNHHVINDSPYEEYINSCVSKQTYKDDYQDSELYQQRRSYLIKLIAQVQVSNRSR